MTEKKFGKDDVQAASDHYFTANKHLDNRQNRALFANIYVACFKAGMPINSMVFDEKESVGYVVEQNNALNAKDDDGNITKVKVAVITSDAVKHGDKLYAEPADDNAIVQQATAWQAVTATLNQVYPDWGSLKDTGLECAVEAIRLLAERAQSNEDSIRLDYLENNWHVCGFARDTKGWYLYNSKTTVDTLRLAIDANRY